MLVNAGKGAEPSLAELVAARGLVLQHVEQVSRGGVNANFCARWQVGKHQAAALVLERTLTLPSGAGIVGIGVGIGCILGHAGLCGSSREGANGTLREARFQRFQLADGVALIKGRNG